MEHILFQKKKIVFKKTGHGPAVVMLHGFMESIHIWDDFSHELSNNHTVICIDLPGHGASECVAEIHPMQLMAEVVKAVLDDQQIQYCVLVAHSMGGYASLAFARKYSKMLMGLCLFHSNALADSEEAKNNRLRAVELINHDKIDFISSFVPSLFAAEHVDLYKEKIEQLRIVTSKMSSTGIIAAQLGMRDRLDTRDVLSHAEFPVFAILGKQDTRMPVEKVMEHLSLPDHVELLILNKCGHMGFIEKKDITLAALISFIERCLLNK